MFEQITSISELVGAIGVILSLLYVGRQLKQTNSMSRSAVHQSLSSQMSEWTMGVAVSPSLAACVAKVHFNNLVRDEATDVEKIQLGYALVGIIAQIYMVYEQRKEGILSQSEADVYGPSNALLTKPYLASAWPILRGTYPPDFCEWFEQRYRLSDD